MVAEATFMVVVEDAFKDEARITLALKMKQI
jgi:hypothetical protein